MSRILFQAFLVIVKYEEKNAKGETEQPLKNLTVLHTVVQTADNFIH